MSLNPGGRTLELEPWRLNHRVWTLEVCQLQARLVSSVGARAWVKGVQAGEDGRVRRRRRAADSAATVTRGRRCAADAAAAVTGGAARAAAASVGPRSFPLRRWVCFPCRTRAIFPSLSPHDPCASSQAAHLQPPPPTPPPPPPAPPATTTITPLPATTNRPRLGRVLGSQCPAACG